MDEARSGSARASIALASAKDSGIETLRGLAILLMVAGHVIGGDAESGLRVPDDSIWRYAYFTLAPLRMPLFTAISGFVYALRPVTRPQWRRFAAGKVRRLVLPLLVVGGAFIAVQMVVPGTNNRLALHDVPRLLVIPYAHFWYLFALAWVFLVVGALDAFDLLSRRWQLLALLIAALVLRGSGRYGTPILGISHAEYLLPYFLLGVGASRFPVARGWALAAALVVPGVMGMALYQAHGFGLPWASNVEEYAVTTLVGATTVAGGLVYRISWRPLAALGPFSYGIYLMHVFGTAGSRIALRSLNVEGVPALALAGLLAGVALPIAIERAIAGRPLLVLLALGRRSGPAARRRPEAALPRLALAPAILPRAAPARHELRVLEGTAALGAMDDPSYRREWLGLYESCPWATTAQHPASVRLRCSAYRSRAAPILVEMREGGRLVGLLPLAIPPGRARTLGALCEDGEYHTWITDPAHGEPFMPAALEVLWRQTDAPPLRLSHLPPGTPLGWAAASAWARRSRLRAEATTLLDLSSADKVAAFLRRKQRLRSKRHRLERHGRLVFRRVQGAREFGALLGRFAEMYTARKLQRTGSSVFLTDPLKTGYLAARQDAAGFQHTTVLELEGVPIAAHIGLAGRRGGAFSLSALAHDPRFDAFSPGALLLTELIPLLQAEGYRWFDLTPGNDAYKARWGDSTRTVHELTVFPSTARRHADDARRLAGRVGRKVLGPVHA